MDSEVQTKKVKCFHKGCKEVVEVDLYADEMQYCPKHERELHNSYEYMWRTYRRYLER